MPISTQLQDHLGGNVTSMCPVVKMVASDSTVAAYSGHTRVLTFGGTLYNVAPVEITKAQLSIGLKSNNLQLICALDDIVTAENIEAGKWKFARIVLEYVNYLDLTMGSTGKLSGVAGKFEIIGPTFKVELRSLGSVLQQQIGEVTSIRDRNVIPSGVDPATYTITRTVTAVASNREFTVGGAALTNTYYEFGLATWASGGNNGLAMEIQGNVGNVITLQLPMSDDIQVGDSVQLLAGYDGTFEMSRDRFSDALDLNSEPFLPSLRETLNYPS